MALEALLGGLDSGKWAPPFFVHTMSKNPNTMFNKLKDGMSIDLPMITQGDQLLIDARLLHKTLEVKTRFNDWIKSRIDDFGFEEKRDFYLNFSKNLFLVGRPKNEYHLTLDMAKELAMLERNEIGRGIRRYFIQKEKQARGTVYLPDANEVFRGITTRKVNNRTMLPYADVRKRCGYSLKGSSANHKNRYWMHFIKEGDLLYITHEFAMHLYYQKMVLNNRQGLKAQQAVIPLNFGDTGLLNQGGRI